MMASPSEQVLKLELMDKRQKGIGLEANSLKEYQKMEFWTNK